MFPSTFSSFSAKATKRYERKFPIGFRIYRMRSNGQYQYYRNNILARILPSPYITIFHLHRQWSVLQQSRSLLFPICGFIQTAGLHQYTKRRTPTGLKAPQRYSKNEQGQGEGKMVLMDIIVRRKKTACGRQGQLSWISIKKFPIIYTFWNAPRENVIAADEMMHIHKALLSPSIMGPRKY
jgi:hypothetical protein